MTDLQEAAKLLDRASELPKIFQGIAEASFNDFCDIADLVDAAPGVFESKHQVHRLIANRKTNGLEAAGAVINKPGMKLKIRLSRFHQWLTEASEAA